MVDEEGFSMGQLIAVGGVMATLGAGGGHLGGEINNDPPVVTGTIGLVSISLSMVESMSVIVVTLRLIKYFHNTEVINNARK